MVLSNRTPLITLILGLGRHRGHFFARIDTFAALGLNSQSRLMGVTHRFDRRTLFVT